MPAVRTPLAIDDPRHGTTNGYSHLGCRCDDCRAASNAYRLARRGAGMKADDPRHGTTNGYNNNGCRCDACRAAWAVEQAAHAASRHARLAADPTIVPHGRVSTYGNWGCRCDPCTKAYSAHCLTVVRRSKGLAS